MGTGNKIKQPYDFDIFGGLNKKGEVPVVKGKQAVINALLSWLLSKEGDYIRRPDEGGFLYNWLCKPMSEYNTNRMLNSLQIGIEYFFSPQIIISSLEVIPDYKHKKYRITLEGYVPDYATNINLSQDFKSLL